MRIALTCLILLSLALPRAHAQAASGVVLDAESGQPIPGANVLLAGSQTGDATDADGRFALVTPLAGSRTLVISAVGYETETRPVVLPTDGLTVRLSPATLSLGEAVVEREQPRLWRQRLRRFEREFIGTSRNARGVRILNPEVLDLRESEGGLFMAEAEATLEVENASLGYSLTLYGLRFTSTGDRWQWQGEVTFREMEGTGRQRRRWERARESAYNGSWPHFAARLASGDAYAAGYRVLPTSRPGTRISINTLTLSEDQLQDAITVVDPGVLRLSVPAAWHVRYLREEDPRSTAARSRGGGQVSYLVLKGGDVSLTPSGQVLDPLDVVRYGYWDWERVADLLPTDYVPSAR
ncbi:carboxypeptidase-like regulatory domain-containing protein [Rubricoccus marinus]|uniref:Carboxypeptidase-like regulatory domain-containing protein n=1 Tax=Rubricoccus marinus TaxID=716817 RepID=A0A259TZ27_9BACT|nr:carboxypeptidase-like regulatory domain-containing protein [Rubricoccus marinus]OZC02838.1 hypothetical protein BSZ36_07535 [Rubricoccus marinus]